jgi:hypothetical protein
MNYLSQIVDAWWWVVAVVAGYGARCAIVQIWRPADQSLLVRRDRLAAIGGWLLFVLLLLVG